MTEKEAGKLLFTIEAMFPSFHPENPEATKKAWLWALKDYPADAIMGALEIYVKTNTTGFAPSVSQLINSMYTPKKNEQLSEGEAWSLVKKAIQDGNYHAEERFNELPPLVQRAVGSPNMIHQWAGTDSDEVNTVIMSNFQRTYRTVSDREMYQSKVPEVLSNTVKALTEKCSFENRLIERSEDGDNGRSTEDDVQICFQ